MKNVRTHIYPSIDIKLKGRKSNAHISSILHESRNYTAPPILQTNPSWVCPCEKINHSSICAVQAALVLGLSINQTTARPSNVRQSDSDDPAHLVDWVTFEILVTMWWISRATGRKTFPPPDCRWAGRITSLINSALLAAPTETFTSKKEKKNWEINLHNPDHFHRVQLHFQSYHLWHWTPRPYWLWVAPLPWMCAVNYVCCAIAVVWCFYCVRGD